VPPLGLLAALAAVSGVVSSLAPLIQIGAMIRARSSKGISLPYLAIGVSNTGVWTAYSFALHNRSMVVSNTLGLAMGVLLFAVTTALRRRAHVTRRPENEVDALSRLGSEAELATAA
jgi:uncharacterized protein with PQ loop repeat